ncbi:MAG: TRAP transporter small permease [Rhodobacteraceae bacterium]|jgi:TRAP-type C4-dicarboxylate transport system permease small subunit|nr:TRAP transporter small permease [Alphaproteobacteria bacterium]MBT8474235.1 TRAP transporter small permease [Alphaproteobacteria bacterium]NNF72006.1 TRAP transporter small permease [Paracoccaceae bacterium]NNK65107.1 TRAP transporter small permease [Paracoccaceae bacterium]
MLDAFERGFEKVLRLLAYAGGLVLAGLALLIIYEIGARYFFGRPFRGGFEMTELAMSVIVACGLPYTAIKRGHVAVDILSGWLDSPSMRWLNFLVHLTGAIMLAILSWRAFDYAASSYGYGDVSNMMRIPKFPFQFAIAISAGLFAIVVLIDALKALRPPSDTPQETS